MNKLFIGLLVFISLKSQAYTDQVYIQDGGQVVVKIENCADGTTPILTLKKDRVIGKCVADVTYCEAKLGHLIPDKWATTYTKYTKKADGSVTKKELIKKARPEHVSTPAVYADVEFELKQLIKQGYCNKGIYKKGPSLAGHSTVVIVEQ